MSRSREVAHHRRLHLILLYPEGETEVFVSSTVVIWALKPKELLVSRTVPSHASLVSLSSGETLLFCAHQVSEVRWRACVWVWVQGEVEVEVEEEL